MSDVSPPSWTAPTMPGDLPLSPGALEPFRWPTPPYAAYPEPLAQTTAEPCVIVASTGSLLQVLT